MQYNTLFIKIDENDEDKAMEQLQELGELLERYPSKNGLRVLSKLQREATLEAIIIQSWDNLDEIQEAVESSYILGECTRTSRQVNY